MNLPLMGVGAFVLASSVECGQRFIFRTKDDLLSWPVATLRCPLMWLHDVFLRPVRVVDKNLNARPQGNAPSGPGQNDIVRYAIRDQEDTESEPCGYEHLEKFILHVTTPFQFPS